MKNTLFYALLVFAAGASYGILVPVIKVAAANGVRAAEFLPSCYLVAFAVCAAVVFVRRVPLSSPRGLAKLAFLGVLTSMTSICYYRAVELLPGAVALTLLFQYVWIGVVVECVAERRAPGASTVAAICIVLVGTVLAAGVFEESFSRLDPFGLAFGAGSSVFYALFLFASGRLGAGEPVSLRTAMAGVGGFVTTLAFNPLWAVHVVEVPQSWPYAIALAAIGVLIPVSVIAFASPHLTTGMVNIMASSELPVGVLAAWAVVGEQPSMLTLAGVALVLAGIVFKQLAAGRGERGETGEQAP